MTTGGYVGKAIPRLEDARFLTGTGRYIADVNLPRQAHAVILRSQHAAAKLRSIEVNGARRMPGVLGVFTADDIGSDLGTTSVTLARNRPDGAPMFWRSQEALASGAVHYVGDPVALVVAETLAQAKDAAEAVAVDYDPFRPVMDPVKALENPSACVWGECADNISNIHVMGDERATNEAFANADHVVRRRYVVSRVYAQFLEPRGAIGAYDADSERYTLYCDVQSPHQIRDQLAKEVLRIPAERLVVIAYDIGGAFGAKASAVEHRLVLWAARKLGRPVKWQAERSESILADEHGRDNAHDVELALSNDGRFLALRAHWIANVGAYINADRNFQTSFVNVPGVTGVYRFPTAFVRSTCVLTNTGQIAPYRGAGRPEATYLIERLIDDAARELGIDRLSLRRKNIIPTNILPHRTPLGFTYDCGDFAKCMELALKMADWEGFPARRKASRSNGLLRGIGVANPIERAGPPTMEYAEISLSAAGTATVLIGTKNHGQGHETTFTQLVCEKLNLGLEDVSIVDGDTARIAFGNGTFGSRSSGIGGAVLGMAADDVIKTGRQIAAHLLEAGEGDVVFDNGAFTIAGSDRAITLKEVARAAWQPENLPPGAKPGLSGSAKWAPETCTYPYGTHICEVEIDSDTGEVRIDRYCVVDDVGVVINPLIVKGQIHGGIAQGAGQVLQERIVYDQDSGQCLTGSFMDYAMPRAGDLCAIEVGSIVTRTTVNPLGIKGVGEAGAVGALPAVMNAIMDALSLLGVRTLRMPATSFEIWQAIETHAQRGS